MLVCLQGKVAFSVRIVHQILKTAKHQVGISTAIFSEDKKYNTASSNVYTLGRNSIASLALQAVCCVPVMIDSVYCCKVRIPQAKEANNRDLNSIPFFGPCLRSS